MGHKNNLACTTFVSFIAKEQKNCLLNSLSKISCFFSLQANASVDAGNVELRVIFITYFDAFAKDGVVHIPTKVFTARHLDSGTGEGLFVSLKEQ